MESNKRSIIKAFSFRFVATVTTVILIIVFTGNFALAGTIGMLDVVSKLLLYYFHERMWNNISWGFKKV